MFVRALEASFIITSYDASSSFLILIKQFYHLSFAIHVDLSSYNLFPFYMFYICPVVVFFKIFVLEKIIVSCFCFFLIFSWRPCFYIWVIVSGGCCKSNPGKYSRLSAASKGFLVYEPN